MPWKDEDGIWRWGMWMFLLHDRGWLVCYDQVLKCEMPWPRSWYGTKKYFRHT